MQILPLSKKAKKAGKNVFQKIKGNIQKGSYPRMRLSNHSSIDTIPFVYSGLNILFNHDDVHRDHHGHDHLLRLLYLTQYYALQILHYLPHLYSKP